MPDSYTSRARRELGNIARGSDEQFQTLLRRERKEAANLATIHTKARLHLGLFLALLPSPDHRTECNAGLVACASIYELGMSLVARSPLTLTLSPRR